MELLLNRYEFIALKLLLLQSTQLNFTKIAQVSLQWGYLITS
jgi:hypothetical protein